MALQQDTGKVGEELAASHLTSLGFSILERNWRFKHLELDIIARKGNLVVIAEVKMRMNDEYGTPESFLGKKQQRQLIRAADEYIRSHDLDVEVRFDVFAITGTEETHRLNHIEDAFYPVP